MKDFDFYARNRSWILAGVEGIKKVLQSWYFFAFLIVCLAFVPILNLIGTLLFPLWVMLYFDHEIKALKWDREPEQRWKSVRHWNSFNAILMIVVSIITFWWNNHIGLYNRGIEIWSLWQAIALLAYGGVYVSVAIRIFEFRLKG